MFFFTDQFGLRGDVRYFRSLEDVEPENLLDVGFRAISASGAGPPGRRSAGDKSDWPRR